VGQLSIHPRLQPIESESIMQEQLGYLGGVRRYQLQPSILPTKLALRAIASPKLESFKKPHASSLDSSPPRAKWEKKKVKQRLLMRKLFVKFVCTDA